MPCLKLGVNIEEICSWCGMLSAISSEPSLIGLKVKKSITKFLENRTQLNLSLLGGELFYKIILIEENKLEVENLTTNNVICFEKLGTNAYKKDEKTSPEENNETFSAILNNLKTTTEYLTY